jgi:hypothetical protein
MGRSRGGLTSKIHALVDADGRPIAFRLTGGQVHDSNAIRSEEHLIRITVQPDEENGLREPSQIMIDRAATIPRAKAGAVFGHVDTRTMKSVDDALGRFFGIGRQ